MRKPYRRMNRRPATLLALAVLAGGCVLAAGGARAETSPWYLGAALSASHDTNLLRLGDNQAVPAGFARSDWVDTTTLLGGFDQQFGRQHAYSNLVLRSNRYRYNDRFNDTGYSGTLGLDWSAPERVAGTLLATANRSLQLFSAEGINEAKQKNLETVKSLQATLNVGMVTEYSLETNAGHRQVSNSLDDPAVQARAFSQDNLMLGGRWRPSPDFNLGLGAGATRGRYPQFTVDSAGQAQSDRYRRTDYEVTLGYKPSGASTLDLRLSSSELRYTVNSERNFQGVTGSLGWVWQATGKTRLSARYTRDTGQDSYLTSRLAFNGIGLSNVQTTADYSRVNNALQVNVDYEVTAKIFLAASHTHTRRTLVNTFSSFTDTAEGVDTTSYTTLSLRWAPQRTLLLGCNYGNERRVASGPFSANLRSETVGCYGQITLQ